MPELFALDPNATIEYTPKVCADLPEGGRPVFILRRTLRPTDEARILNAISEGVAITGDEAGPVRIKLGLSLMRCIQTLRILLKGWKNLRNPDGTEVEFVIDKTDGHASEDSVNRIPKEIIEEIVSWWNERGSLGGLSAEEKKSLISPPSSSAAISRSETAASV